MINSNNFVVVVILREEVAEIFEKMDRDFDGKLSFEELMGEETPLEGIFRSIDKDGDGTVTKEVDELEPAEFFPRDTSCE